MIKINNILGLVNDGLGTHYFKDITFHKIAELKLAKDAEIERPYIFVGDGNYQFVQDDSKSLIVYHRLLDFDNEEDTDGGFGRNSKTVENISLNQHS